MKNHLFRNKKGHIKRYALFIIAGFPVYDFTTSICNDQP